MKNKSEKKLWLLFAMIVIAGCAIITCGGETDTDKDKTPEPVTTPDNPVNRVEAIDLGVMTSSESGWRKLLDSIQSAEKYINLDLSACTMTGTSFNPDSTVSTGKPRIISIILPAAATEIAGGTTDDYTFKSFSRLKSVSGENITAIGEYSFTGSKFIDSLLKDINFPKAASIGKNAFSNCVELQSVSFPLLTSIGDFAFSDCEELQSASFPLLTSIGDRVFTGCGKLQSASFPLVTSIGETAFGGCGSLITLNIPSITYIDFEAFGGNIGSNELSITMGVTAPTLYTSIFSGAAKTVRVKVPAAASGYSPFSGSTAVTVSGNNSTENWANGFRGNGWDGSGFVNKGGFLHSLNENITVIIELQ